MIREVDEKSCGAKRIGNDRNLVWCTQGIKEVLTEKNETKYHANYESYK